MSEEFRKQGIPLVAISADTAGDSAEFIAEQEITVPLLSDPGLGVITAYGVAMKGGEIAVPSTFVIRQDRTIAWQYIGEDMTDRPESSRLLELALAER